MSLITRNVDLTVWPLAFSNLGMTSCIHDSMAAAHRNVISAARARSGTIDVSTPATSAKCSDGLKIDFIKCPLHHAQCGGKSPQLKEINMRTAMAASAFASAM